MLKVFWRSYDVLKCVKRLVNWGDRSWNNTDPIMLRLNRLHTRHICARFVMASVKLRKTKCTYKQHNPRDSSVKKVDKTSILFHFANFSTLMPFKKEKHVIINLS